VRGGLPEPSLTRWQPLRVGILNLWEYDNTEFWFADGRMVLRGANGAGKTKVLELATLMLMRGEVGPSVLDPFGSQHRTMKYNLLPSGEADDPREPADIGLGYAWVEFGRRDLSGECHYFVCGLGASARRGTGTSPVNPWQFITALRPGVQLRLASGGYPIEEKELKKIDGVWVRSNAAQYRERLAKELFGLEDLESYDNLTELLKQLRKPKLGERLNPASLAETLRDSLPPLAGHEVAQLADGWEHLEQLRIAVEKTERSAAAVATFVRTGWRPWVRATVRRHADTLAEATTALDNTTKTKRLAEQALAAAREQLGAVQEQQFRLGLTISDRETEREELLQSSAFQDAVRANQRVIELSNTVAGLSGQQTTAQTRVSQAQTSAQRAELALQQAMGKLIEAEAEVEAADRVVTERAQAAGLTDSAQRHLPGGDSASLRSDLHARVERFRNLRRLHDLSRRAQQAVDESAKHLERRREEESIAVGDEADAGRALESAVRALQDRIRAWAGHAGAADCTDEQIEEWCDDVTDLTRVDREMGTVAGGPSVTAAIQAHVDGVRERLAAAAAELRRRRDPLADREAAASAELATVRAITEAAPPGPDRWRRRDRPSVGSGEGAPLWRCVEPMPGLDQATLDVVESVLSAASLLDAWLDPVAGRGPLDTLVEAGMPRAGRTLAAVMRPTPAGGVSTKRIGAVLASIGWFDTAPAADDGIWLAADGNWRFGQLHGRIEPAGPASYLGATAREAARLRRIAALEDELGRIQAHIADLDEQIAANGRHANILAGERATIPDETDVHRAATLLAERARRRSVCTARVSDAQAEHDTNLRRRDEATAELALFASEHRFPTDGLDAVAEALRAYGEGVGDWQSRLDIHRARAEAVRDSEHYAGDQRERAEAERADLARINDELRAGTIKLATARTNLSAGHAQVLQRRDELAVELTALQTTKRDLDARYQGAWQDAERAHLALQDHEARRQAAESTRDGALASWWRLVDAELVGALGLERPTRRVVETALAGARSIRRDVDVAADPAAVERAWRRCSDALAQLRQDLLPNRDARIDDSDDVLLPGVFVLAESGAGWQMPHVAADTLADRVRSQREAYDAEQHKVLTTLLESTFIEHLKDRLDHTERTFDRINKHLAMHPTRRGQTVKLKWEADPDDPDASAVVMALRQGYQQLVPERQAMVRAFLARRIDDARADLDGPADWKERLASALDYRHWLRIGMQYRPGPGGTWTTFDVAKHGAKSGGEKVVLLSQPLFAAAVVAYDAAGPDAPRWVWLDEAMTGVDSESKASFMGLTVDFDLDAMITAFDEWCKYETVPAVAIYDLSRHPHLPGVASQPYLWCGGEEFRVATDRLGAHGAVAESADDLLALLDGS
jgi:uncharacterized protein (TIGR02680 family)